MRLAAPLIDEVAQIWAEATAARDGHDRLPPLHVSRPVIQALYERLGWQAVGLPAAHLKNRQAGTTL